MHLIQLGPDNALPITAYGSVDAASVPIAEGAGEAHAYGIVFEPGGVIGPHEAGFGQLFFAVVGSGWIAGEDGERLAIRPGQGGFIRRGEVHSKGSEHGMTALMVQVRDLELSEGG